MKLIFSYYRELKTSLLILVIILPKISHYLLFILMCFFLGYFSADSDFFLKYNLAFLDVEYFILLCTDIKSTLKRTITK